MMNFKCTCKNVEIGSYCNQIELEKPKRMVGDNRTPNTESLTICVDSCLKEEIEYLWSIGITTTGCCCGHGKLEPFIGVVPQDIQKMKELGYIVRKNECRTNDEDSFYPKGYIK